MNTHTHVLAVDFSLAGVAATVGALGTGGHPGWATAIAVFGGVVVVGCLYLAEQTAVLALVDRHSPRSYHTVFALTLTVGLVLVLGWTVVASPAATLLCGAGVGLAAYRTQYGLRAPVPETRLEQAGATAAFEVDPPSQP